MIKKLVGCQERKKMTNDIKIISDFACIYEITTTIIFYFVYSVPLAFLIVSTFYKICEKIKNKNVLALRNIALYILCILILFTQYIYGIISTYYIIRIYSNQKLKNNKNSSDDNNDKFKIFITNIENVKYIIKTSSFQLMIGCLFYIDNEYLDILCLQMIIDEKTKERRNLFITIFYVILSMIIYITSSLILIDLLTNILNGNKNLNINHLYLSTIYLVYFVEISIPFIIYFFMILSSVDTIRKMINQYNLTDLLNRFNLETMGGFKIFALLFFCTFCMILIFGAKTLHEGSYIIDTTFKIIENMFLFIFLFACSYMYIIQDERMYFCTIKTYNIKHLNLIAIHRQSQLNHN
jgi:hypothetical protein